MAYSGNIVDYLGHGLAADRPASLDLTPGALGLYYAADDAVLWLWDGSWHAESGGGIPDAPSDGKSYARKNAAWSEIVIPAAASAYNVASEPAAFTATVGTHDGALRYTRAAGNVTFSSAQPYATGMTFPIRATAAISLVGSGVTLTPPAGGTLDLSPAMSVQVVMTSATAGDVVGQTVPA